METQINSLLESLRKIDEMILLAKTDNRIDAKDLLKKEGIVLLL